MNHYVGQEKLAPMDSWATIMSSKDWGTAPRLQQGPIWHYINSCQWRYDGNQKYYNSVPDNKLANTHSADWAVKAVKNGWMPYYPQYSKSSYCTEDSKASIRSSRLLLPNPQSAYSLTYYPEQSCSTSDFRRISTDKS